MGATLGGDGTTTEARAVQPTEDRRGPRVDPPAPLSPGFSPASAAYTRGMASRNECKARFDEVVTGGHRRVTVGLENRDRESDGSIPTAAWFRGEEYRLDIEDEAGVAVYV